MTWIDTVIIIIIIIFLTHGIITGFIRGIFDIIGIIVGYILSIRYALYLKIPKIWGIILIFVGVVIVVSITGRIISKLIHYTPLGVMDRLLGGLLGFIKGIIVAFVFLIIIIMINKGDTIKKSEIAPVILKAGISASQILPKKWYRWIKNLIEKGELVDAHNHFPF